MRRSIWRSRIALVAIAAGLLCIGSVHAKKPDKPGGGGGGSTTSPRFAVVEIPVEGDPAAISEPDFENLVTVSIDASEDGYGSAAFALVDATDGSVVASGFLPEPLFVDPNDGEMKNGPSQPADVNVYGEIVGLANTYDPTLPPESDPSPDRAIRWLPDGDGYRFELLPSLTGATESRAFGTNNWGDIVGLNRLGGDDGADVAVFWDAETLTPVDLNTEQTAALGWELRAAYDINDGGLVVGYGFLNGVFRGYFLDLASGDIWPAPLIGPATGNVATRVNEVGRGIGHAWDGEGRPWGTDPDYHLAYSWDGPATDPLALPSVTNNTSIAGGLNDLGAIVGSSVIPTDDLFENRWVPTLWELNGQGDVVATDLQTEISSESPYELIRAHDVNNEGWISVFGRKRHKGRYEGRALLLVPSTT